jgi:hypothetical protein
MEQLPNPLDKTLSRFSMRLPTQPLPEQVEAAKRATKRIMSAFPDYGKAPPDYMVALMECLTWLSPQEMGWIMDPRNGLVTVCKFLPTPGDVHEFIREKHAKAEQFKSHPTSGYTKFEPLPDKPEPVVDAERKKKVVRELLGYNPSDRNERRGPPAFKTKPIDGLRSSADCLRQDGGPSGELLELVERQAREGVRWF